MFSEFNVGNTYQTSDVETQSGTSQSKGISIGIKSSTVEGRGPLKKLFTNEFELNNLKYPEEVGTDKKRPHVVKFFINVPESSSFNLTRGSNANETPIAAQQTLFGSENTATIATMGGITGAIAGYAKNQTLGAAVVGGAAGAAIGALANAPITPKQNRLKGSITLYMPDTVNMSYDVGYQEDNLTDNTLVYLGNLGVALKDTTGAAAEGLIKNLTSGEGTDGKGTAVSAAALAALRASPIGSTLPVDTLLKGQGVAINPQVQLLFKAVSLRTFQMEFMFSPKSQKESQAVADIVRTFKFHAAPEVAGTTDGGRSTGLFFVVPSTFNIEFLFRDQNDNMGQNTSLHRIGECVLENVNVDYAPNGWSTFEDGSPTQVRLTLNFKETDIVDKNKIAQGY